MEATSVPNNAHGYERSLVNLRPVPDLLLRGDGLPGPRVSDRGVSASAPDRRRKLFSVGAARLPQIGGLSIEVFGRHRLEIGSKK